MRLPIKNEINILLTCLPEFIEKRNNIIQELFKHEEKDKVQVLEYAIVGLLKLQEKFNEEIDKLTEKVSKEIEKEKKKTRSLNIK